MDQERKDKRLDEIISLADARWLMRWIVRMVYYHHNSVADFHGIDRGSNLDDFARSFVATQRAGGALLESMVLCAERSCVDLDLRIVLSHPRIIDILQSTLTWGSDNDILHYRISTSLSICLSCAGATGAKSTIRSSPFSAIMT